MGRDQVEKRHAARRRRLGKFYTPTAATALLCKWAIRKREDLVLEPSFGGCEFLKASRTRLKALGARHRPGKNLFGCDIDPDAFQHLKREIGIPKGTNFLKGDFLRILPKAFPAEFDVVLGNPPYVSYHNMSKRQRRSINRFRDRHEFAPSGHASLWSYFVLHSISFLRPGGRMAWILPSSFLHSNYSSDLHRQLELHFEKVLAISLTQRLFRSEGTDEATVILLADGKREKAGGPDCTIQLEFSKKLSDISKIINQWSRSKTRSTSHMGVRPLTRLQSVSKVAAEEFAKIEGSTRPLSDFFSLGIGFVTGANEFFVLDKETAEASSLPPKALRPILSRGKLAKGLSVSTWDLKRGARAGDRCLLVDTARSKSKLVDNYLKTFPKRRRDKILTFKKRTVWHQVDDGKIPAAFLTYTNDIGPKLIINTARTNSTNSIYRAYKKRGVKKHEVMLCSLALLSTFGQLSAEVVGRSCGMGALKHEPSDAAKIAIPFSKSISKADVKATFRDVNRLLKQGDKNAAIEAADDFFRTLLPRKLTPKTVKRLRRALTAIRRERRTPVTQGEISTSSQSDGV